MIFSPNAARCGPFSEENGTECPVDLTKHLADWKFYWLKEMHLPILANSFPRLCSKRRPENFQQPTQFYSNVAMFTMYTNDKYGSL